MSVTVGSIYSQVSAEYGMKLAAGAGGVDRPVDWVHIVEDSRVSSFLRGGELVFTTGIMNNTASWLRELVKHVDMAGASGIVVNLGPYIPSVPDEVAAYCNKHNFPLFTIPWETRMVDMTRDICSVISRSLNDEISMSAALKGLVLNTADAETALRILEAGGFCADAGARLACVGMGDERDFTSQDKFALERAAKSVNELYCAFEYGRYMIVLLSDCNAETVDMFCDRLREADKLFSVGISGERLGLKAQQVNFKRALCACKMAVKRGKDRIFYDELGIYKILLEVNDKDVLGDYYRDVLGSLEDYDSEHGTDYLNFLKTYLECNGITQVVSEREFIHRNTVVNHLKKIEKITGLNLLELDAKLKCGIALCIKELID